MRFTKIITLLLVIAIFIVGVYLYFYKLGDIPKGFYIDEAMPGYNAYSILKTGKDEYGKYLPLFFRFYGSYNQPLYTYLTVLSIKQFGLSVFSVRFVAALAGLLSVIPFAGLLYSSGLFKKKFSIILGAFLFMISPWLIFYGRIGYEVSLAFLFFVSGVLFAWLGLKKQKYFILSVLLFSLSTYSAYAGRLVVPIFIFSFILFFRKQIFSIKNKKYLYITFILGLISQIPNLWLLTTPAFLPKSDLFYGSTVFSQAVKSSRFLPYFISYPLSFIREFLSLYLTYFSPRSLFFAGDPDLQRSIPELAVFYSWEIVPYLFGLYIVIKERKNLFIKLLIILIFITPIPAALTKDPFSTHRAMMLLLPLSFVISLGVDRIILRLNKLVAVSTFVFLIFFSFVLLWRSYFVFMPNERARYWGYGLEQLSQIIVANPNKHFIIDTSRIKPPYMNLAFFMRIDPAEYQKSVDQNIKNNYYTDLKFDGYYRFANLETKSIDWKTDLYKNVVLVGDTLAVSEGQAKDHGLTKMFEIKDPMGEIVFQGYEK